MDGLEFLMDKTKIGIIGCGNISGTYVRNSYRFRNLELVAYD